MSYAVHSIRSPANYWAVVNTEVYSKPCQAFKVECFAKKIMLECRHTTRNFQGSRGFIELGHFDKHFAKNTRKKALRETFWRFFSQILLKQHFE